MRTLPVTAEVLELLMASDGGLQVLQRDLAAAGFKLTKTMGYPTKRGGVTVRAVWRRRQDGQTADINTTFRFDGAQVGVARKAAAEAAISALETAV